MQAGPAKSVRCAVLTSGHISFVEIWSKIISMAILSLPLIELGQLSVTVEQCMLGLLGQSDVPS